MAAADADLPSAHRAIRARFHGAPLADFHTMGYIASARMANSARLGASARLNIGTYFQATGNFRPNLHGDNMGASSTTYTNRLTRATAATYLFDDVRTGKMALPGQERILSLDREGRSQLGAASGSSPIARRLNSRFDPVAGIFFFSRREAGAMDQLGRAGTSGIRPPFLSGDQREAIRLRLR